MVIKTVNSVDRARTLDLVCRLHNALAKIKQKPLDVADVEPQTVEAQKAVSTFQHFIDFGNSDDTTERVISSQLVRIGYWNWFLDLQEQFNGHEEIRTCLLLLTENIHNDCELNHSTNELSLPYPKEWSCPPYAITEILNLLKSDVPINKIVKLAKYFYILDACNVETSGFLFSNINELNADIDTTLELGEGAIKMLINGKTPREVHDFMFFYTEEKYVHPEGASLAVDYINAFSDDEINKDQTKARVLLFINGAFQETQKLKNEDLYLFYEQVGIFIEDLTKLRSCGTTGCHKLFQKAYAHVFHNDTSYDLDEVFGANEKRIPREKPKQTLGGCFLEAYTAVNLIHEKGLQISAIDVETEHELQQALHPDFLINYTDNKRLTDKLGNEAELDIVAKGQNNGSEIVYFCEVKSNPNDLTIEQIARLINLSQMHDAKPVIILKTRKPRLTIDEVKYSPVIRKETKWQQYESSLKRILNKAISEYKRTYTISTSPSNKSLFVWDEKGDEIIELVY